MLDEDKFVKILGLPWTQKTTHSHLHAVDDSITTKRNIHRQSSLVYDPVGILISPIYVRSKMLMQRKWEMKVDWDEPLSSDVILQRDREKRDTKDFSNLRFPT